MHVTLLAPETALSYRSRTPEEEAGATELADLVNEAGGVFMDASGANGRGFASYDRKEKQRRALAAGLSLMYRGMTANDLVDIELPQSVGKWRKWSLELSPKTKKLLKDLWLASLTN